MKKVEIKGAIRRYLRLPIYMLIPIALVAIGMGMYDHKLILPLVVIVAVYGFAAFIMYFLVRQRCLSSLMNLAMGIETSQKAFLLDMPIPYAVFNKEGMLLWQNICFENQIGKADSPAPLLISSLLPKVDRAVLKKLGDDPLKLSIEHNGAFYSGIIKKINEPGEGETEIISAYSIVLFDETKSMELEEKLDADKIVVANVFIDNYDETIADVDDVKTSMLAAVVERKIRKYFAEADAIIRKVEKDKYFVIFPKRFLSKLIDNKFSLLEDIKNTKVGNETEITLSIGMGLNGDTFVKDAEYAKTATSLALGRGGSQCVVKDAGEVTIFGVKGKEIAKNARVKARVKAQALKELMTNREQVIVMGHEIADFDSIGAAIGIAVAARQIGKPCHVVLNTVTASLRPLLNTFKEDENFEGLFISSEEAINLVDKNTLIVVVDTNIPNHTECPDIFNKTSYIVVFDHHRQGKFVIENPTLSYIEPYASSTCEMVAEILQYFDESIQIAPKEADALYAGMLIDTSSFMTKTGVRTFEAAAYLRRMGAEVSRVRKLLREDISSYKAKAEIVRSAEVYKEAFAISVCNAGELESPTVVAAQAANELLNIIGIKASFVITEFNGKIYVSSRSIDEIDVHLIMEKLGGGGHLNIAGAQVKDSTVEAVSAQIHEIIDSMIEEGMIK